MPAAAFTVDSISTAMLLLLLVLTCLFLTLSSRSKGQLSPGPRSLLFLNLLQLHWQGMLTSLTKLSTEYSSVYAVHLGPRLVVVLSGYQAMKEAPVDAEEFSGHGSYRTFFNFTKGNGITFSNGEQWKVLRKFSIQILWNFRMEKRSFEEQITEEGNVLQVELWNTGAGCGTPDPLSPPPSCEPFDPTFAPSHLVCNIISSMVFSSCFDYNNNRLLMIIHLLHDNSQILSSPWEPPESAPSPGVYLSKPSGLGAREHRGLFQNFGHMKDLIACSIHDHQASPDTSSPQDFIDCFLIRMEQVNPTWKSPLV
ncbi:LOW QUALITY PROTEIN: cytochrome P450 2F3-like [Glossophaga mutica]